ncbi:hypothetical protein ACFW04_008733 [Cataglyphis niger]
MQNINLNKCSTYITENKDPQNIAEYEINDEVVTLQQQITELNKAIVNLEDAMQIKDTQIENTHREKGRLLAELKKQQRCNRNLKQQLDDERFFYQREKEHFIEEMQRYRTKYTGNMSKFQQQQHKELEQTQDMLETENKRLEEELVNKNEVIYNTCIKFLRMKHAKDTLRYKLDQLLHEHLLVIAEMMEKLDEARKELNLIVSEKFQEPLPLNKAKFLQVVQKNNRLMYENATLKVQVQQLTQSIEKLKSQIQRPKKINIDAKIIEKLSMQNNTRSTLINKTEKIALLSKLSQPINYFEDAKNYDSKKFQTERAQSAPGIVETSAISQQNR